MLSDGRLRLVPAEPLPWALSQHQALGSLAVGAPTDGVGCQGKLSFLFLVSSGNWPPWWQESPGLLGSAGRWQLSSKEQPEGVVGRICGLGVGDVPHVPQMHGTGTCWLGRVSWVTGGPAPHPQNLVICAEMPLVCPELFFCCHLKTLWQKCHVNKDFEAATPHPCAATAGALWGRGCSSGGRREPSSARLMPWGFRVPSGP